MLLQQPLWLLRLGHLAELVAVVGVALEAGLAVGLGGVEARAGGGGGVGGELGGVEGGRPRGGLLGRGSGVRSSCGQGSLQCLLWSGFGLVSWRCLVSCCQVVQ